MIRGKRPRSNVKAKFPKAAMIARDLVKRFKRVRNQLNRAVAMFTPASRTTKIKMNSCNPIKGKFINFGCKAITKGKKKGTIMNFMAINPVRQKFPPDRRLATIAAGAYGGVRIE